MTAGFCTGGPFSTVDTGSIERHLSLSRFGIKMALFTRASLTASRISRLSKFI